MSWRISAVATAMMVTYPQSPERSYPTLLKAQITFGCLSYKKHWGLVNSSVDKHLVCSFKKTTNGGSTLQTCSDLGDSQISEIWSLSRQLETSQDHPSLHKWTEAPRESPFSWNFEYFQAWLGRKLTWKQISLWCFVISDFKQTKKQSKKINFDVLSEFSDM